MSNWFGGTQPYDNAIEFVRTGFGYVLNWIRMIGNGLALIMITYLAFRYITNENPNAKMEMRKSFQAYFIGIIVYLGASNLIYYVAQMAYNIAHDLLIS